MESKLINRGLEKEAIKGMLRDVEGILLFIIAPSGIGKTALTRSVEEEILGNSFITLRVESAVVNNEVKSDGFLLRGIAKAIDNKSSSDINIRDFSTYSKKLISKSKRVVHNAEVIDGIRLLKPISLIYKRHNTTNIQAKERIVNPDFNIDLLEIKEYVYSSFKELSSCDKETIIIIENIHVCDEISIRFLSELLYEYSNIKVIFEYTSRGGNDSAHGISSVKDIFYQVNDRIRQKYIRKLDDECIKKILEIWNVNEEVFNTVFESYKYTDGNVKKLEDFNSLIQSDVPLPEHTGSDVRKKLENLYTDIFQSLSNDSIFVVSILACANMPVNIGLINLIAVEAESSGLIVDIGIGIDELLNRGGLIRRINNTLHFSHDSLDTALRKTEIFEKNETVVFNIISILFENILKNEDFVFVSKIDCLSFLIHHYYNLGSNKIVILFEYFKNDQMKNYAPNMCVDFLEKAKEIIVNGEYVIDEEMFYSIVIVYYELNMFQLGYDIIDKYKNHDSGKYKVYKIAFLNKMEMHEQCIKFCNHYLSKRNIALFSREEAFNLIVILIASYRSLNKIDECKKLFLKVERKGSTFHTTDAYATFLRNAGVALSVEESLKYMHKARAYYHKKTNYIEEGKVLLSLAMQYTRLGDIDKAKRCIDESMVKLESRAVDDCMIQNNYAVILIIKGDYKEAFKSLVRAKNIVSSDFSRVVILYNIISALYFMRDRENIEKYITYTISSLNDFRNQRNLSLDRSVYYNLSVIYEELFENIDKSSHFMLKAKSLNIPNNDYWKSRLYGDSSSHYLANFPVHLGFLSHWAIKLD